MLEVVWVSVDCVLCNLLALVAITNATLPFPFGILSCSCRASVVKLSEMVACLLCAFSVPLGIVARFKTIFWGRLNVLFYFRPVLSPYLVSDVSFVVLCCEG